MSDTQKQQADPNEAEARLLAAIQKAEEALKKAGEDLEKNTKEAKNFYEKVLNDKNKIKKLSVKEKNLKWILFNMYGYFLGLSAEIAHCKVQLFSNRLTQFKWMKTSCELLSESVVALACQICAVKGQIPPDIKKKLENLQTSLKDVNISGSQVFIGQSEFSQSPISQSQAQGKKWYEGLMPLSLGAIKKIFGL